MHIALAPFELKHGASSSSTATRSPRSRQELSLSHRPFNVPESGGEVTTPLPEFKLEQRSHGSPTASKATYQATDGRQRTSCCPHGSSPAVRRYPTATSETSSKRP
jgi:hypothetical protein